MKRLYPADFADQDENTSPGLPACTIIGPMSSDLDPPRIRPPATRIPYHVRYPPTIDPPLFVSFNWADADRDDDADMPEHVALGSHSKGRIP